MIHWLTEQKDFFENEGLVSKFLNLLEYHTLRSGAALITSFLLSMFFGEKVLRKLISLKIGQPIRTREEVQKLYDLQGHKAGTPTMGGVLILATFTLSVLIWTDWKNPVVWVVLGSTIALGGLGFWDDYMKVSKKNSKGVSARTKLAYQFAVAIVAALLFAYVLPGGISWDGQPVSYRSLTVPFFKDPLMWDMGFFSVVLFCLIIVGFSNAVNLTDGLDGLATGCSISTGLAYGVFCYLVSNVKYAKFLLVPYFASADELTIVAMALVGSCMGFLWFNCQPARMFMGDTGSLALGGAIATLAIGCKQELLLLVVGGVFVMEAGSVMLQVLSFKTTGKRIFRMSPIHHHFELGGWKESQVVVRFWMLSLMLALFALSTLKLR